MNKIVTGDEMGQRSKMPNELTGGKFKGTFKGKVRAVREDGTLSNGVSYSKFVRAESVEEQKVCIDDLLREGFHDFLPVADTLKWSLEAVRYGRDQLVEVGYLSEAETLAEGYDL